MTWTTKGMPHISGTEVIERTQLYREHFGLAANPMGDPDQFEAALKQLNPRFEGERTLVRFELEESKAKFAPDQVGAVIMTAVELDMLKQETPLVGEFDIVVAHGAARMAPYDRVHYGAKAIVGGQASGRLVAVGSTRPLEIDKGELQAASAYAPPDAQTEADLAKAAAVKVSEEFDIEVEHLAVDNPKATTADSLRAIVERYGADRIYRIGGVTTQIYWAKFDITSRVVGKTHGFVSAVAGNPSNLTLVGRRTTDTYHSEILSTLFAAMQELRQQA